MLTRDQALAGAADGVHDVVIVGGGVGGAAVFRELGRRGHRVLLIDRGDFASGTSQSSGMLIWGGLLYLKSLDLRTVLKLSAARDRLLRTDSSDVSELRFRYMPLRDGGRPRWLVASALAAYWLLGGCRRRRPRAERRFACEGLLHPERFSGSLVYEEAGLTSSDSRFVLGWLLDRLGTSRVPINHCELCSGSWSRGERLWTLEVEDRIRGARLRVRARTLINAGGVWADRVNQRCGIESAYRHVFSKGVYLAFRRPPRLRETLVFEMGQHGDSQTFTPWGPVALWGPTETSIETIEEGLGPDVGDVRFLLDQANRNLRQRRGPEDIISLRCGIRPLAVKRGFRSDRYPLSLSRRHVIARDRKSAALTLYGGKITSAPVLARQVADSLEGYLGPRTVTDPDEVAAGVTVRSVPSTLAFPGVEEAQPDPAWCAVNENCATLDDYMRRRTNLAQWVRRSGLGERGENEARVLGIARRIYSTTNDEDTAMEMARDAVANLRSQALRSDRILGAV